MRAMIDYEATIQSFFNDAISWLESRPVRLRNNQNKEQIACEYMKMVQSNPRQYTAKNAVYANCDKLDGFMEHRVDKNGNLITNNELFLSVIRVLDAMGKYYETDYDYTRSELLKNIKQFKIALNRNDLLKSTFYKIQVPYYFAQKQK